MRGFPLFLALSLVCAPAGAAADPTADLFERPAGRARDARLNRFVDLSPAAGVSAVTVQRARGAAAAGVTAAATGNVVSVAQTGMGNTLILSVTQRNEGAISAGVALNGRLSLD